MNMKIQKHQLFINGEDQSTHLNTKIELWKKDY